MEQYKENDGIYAGRFVLIEYDNEMHMDSFLRVRKDGNNFYTTFSEDTSKEVLLTKGKIHPGTIVYTSAYETLPANGYYAKNCTFYKCTSEYIQDSEELATFEDIVGEGELNPHVTNYSIDSRVYGRGYDSYVVIHLGENSAHMEKFDDDIIVNRITIKDINYHIKEA